MNKAPLRPPNCGPSTGNQARSATSCWRMNFSEMAASPRIKSGAEFFQNQTPSGQQRRPGRIRREARPFIVEAFGEHALARSVGLEDADAESAARLAGEGDVVAARRPDRRRA